MSMPGYSNWLQVVYFIFTRLVVIQCASMFESG